MNDTRQAIVAWAQWAHQNAQHFNYTEGPLRMSAIGVYPPQFPINADCSAFVTWCYWIAGADDPNGLGYNHTGYTGTLLSHGLEIPLAKCSLATLSFMAHQRAGTQRSSCRPVPTHSPSRTVSRATRASCTSHRTVASLSVTCASTLASPARLAHLTRTRSPRLPSRR